MSVLRDDVDGFPAFGQRNPLVRIGKSLSVAEDGSHLVTG